MTASPGIASAGDVIAFWTTAGPDKWFNKDAAFDAEIRVRFLSTHEAAAAGRLGEWEKSANGALALIIVLDQFSRNMFRGSAQSFAADLAALEIARRAIARGDDKKVPSELRAFFYLPFMHSEVLTDQEQCVALYRAAGDTHHLKYAEEHAAIIRQFGRFPHRNIILGRAMTAEEQAFLDSGGFTG